MNHVFSHTSHTASRCVYAIALFASMVVLLATGDKQVRAESPVDSNAHVRKAMSAVRPTEGISLPQKRMSITMSEHDTQALQNILKNVERECGAVQGEFSLQVLTATDGSVESVSFEAANPGDEMLTTISSVCKRLQSCRLTPIEVDGTAVSGMVHVRVKMLK